MEIHRWEILSSTRPYQNLRVDEVLLPNGKIVQKLIHEYSPWATVLAITKQKEVVLVRQYRHGVQEIILEFPGGVIDDGEDPLDAAKRELVEESGYSGGEWIQVGAPSPNPDNHTNRIYSFVAQNVELTAELHFDADEEIEVVLKPIADVIQMAYNGELLQAMQISALFLALPHLK